MLNHFREDKKRKNKWTTMKMRQQRNKRKPSHSTSTADVQWEGADRGGSGGAVYATKKEEALLKE